MRNNNNQNRIQQFSNDYEFDNESDQEMEYSSGLYSETEYEFVPGLEINEESDYESDYENDYEEGQQYESEYADREMQYETAENEMYKDEMEAELENVTNEQEFEDWVNEIVVRDHRTRNLRPVLRTPAGRTAVRQMSTIASRTLPYLGARRGGWQRPVSSARYRPPAYRRTPVQQRAPWNRNFRRPFFWRGPRAINQSYYSSGQYIPPYPDINAMNNTPAYAGPAAMPPQLDTQDGSFKNFVLDTLKNLSEQIAMGNQNSSAVNSSMVNSAATNMPDLVQPKTEDPAPMNAAANTTPPPAPVSNEFEAPDYEYATGIEGEVMDSEGSFSEETELELATELLSLQNESELEYFLSDLISKAVGTVSKVLKTPQGKIFKGLLKNVAKKALPLAGMAIGIPPAGLLAGELRKDAAELFELELEGLSSEDREFEVAKAIVRFGGNASKQLDDQPRSNDPQEDVKRAVTASAARYAPGMVTRREGNMFRRGNYQYPQDAAFSGNRGTWHRKGNRIIIDNAF